MKITTLQLTDSEKHNLEIAYQTGDSHCYRTRCKGVLLKSQGKSASEIASFLDVSIPSVYSWIKRYKADGIKGLETNQEAEENLSLIAPMRKSSAKPLRRIAKASARQGRHGRMQQARRRAMQH